MGRARRAVGVSAAVGAAARAAATARAAGPVTDVAAAAAPAVAGAAAAAGPASAAGAGVTGAAGRAAAYSAAPARRSDSASVALLREHELLGQCRARRRGGIGRDRDGLGDAMRDHVAVDVRLDRHLVVVRCRDAALEPRMQT